MIVKPYNTNYLPNVNSRQIILGNCMCRLCTKEKILGEEILKDPAKITLPISLVN